MNVLKPMQIAAKMDLGSSLGGPWGSAEFVWGLLWDLGGSLGVLWGSIGNPRGFLGIGWAHFVFPREPSITKRVTNYLLMIWSVASSIARATSAGKIMGAVACCYTPRVLWTSICDVCAIAKVWVVWIDILI